ncbi:hypothetical protein Dimus_009071 [Dionaea muscipula]
MLKPKGNIQARGTTFVHHGINHQLFHSQNRQWNDNHSDQKPNKKPYSRPRKPIPFVADLKQVHEPDEALSLFHEYHELGVKHDYPSYASLTYKLARCQNFDRIEPLLDFIKYRGIRCQERLFIALIQHYGKRGFIDKSIQLFHQIPRFNCDRTLQSFNTLLNVLVDNGRFADANELFGRSKELGYRPNSVSFNVIIKGCLGNGDFERACQVFDEMLGREVLPSVVTYNSLIGFLCKNGDVGKAMGFLDEMTRKRKHPDAVTYALLMEGLCSVGKYKEAKKLMFDMEYRGCKSQVVNFGVLMSDLGKRGKIEEAKSLLLEMKKKRLKPDVVIYNILINYSCKEGRPDEAYKILVEMQMKRCEPNAASYRMLVDGFCQAGEFERGLGILHAMLMSRHCPRVDTFCNLVIGLWVGGKIDDASFVLEEMVKRKMAFQYDSWRSLVTDHCCSDEAATQLLNDLVMPSANPTVTGTTLILPAHTVQYRGLKGHAMPCQLLLKESIFNPLSIVHGQIFATGRVAVALQGVSRVCGWMMVIGHDIPTVSTSTPLVAAAAAAAAGGAPGTTDHALIFFMHDILGGLNPSAKVVTGIVDNPAAGGQVPFAKPNGAILPTTNNNNANSGLINNNNIPFLTGLSGTIPNIGNNLFTGGNGFPVVNGAQLQAGMTIQKLMFGTLTVIDDELTEGEALGSAMVGKAQGFYIVSSEDGTSQTMVFTTMFEEGGYVDSLCFFGVHRTAVSESQLAVMGGTGKYVNAKGIATVKIVEAVDQHETDGVETVLQFTVYLTY